MFSLDNGQSLQFSPYMPCGPSSRSVCSGSVVFFQDMLSPPVATGRYAGVRCTPWKASGRPRQGSGEQGGVGCWPSPPEHMLLPSQPRVARRGEADRQEVRDWMFLSISSKACGDGASAFRKAASTLM